MIAKAKLTTTTLFGNNVVVKRGGIGYEVSTDGNPVEG